MSKPAAYSSELLQNLSNQIGISIETEEFAKYLDDTDELASYREKFYYPKNSTIPVVDLNIMDGNDECIYFCGNSLGLCPKTASTLIDQEMKKWQECGVIGHTTGAIPWEIITEDILYQAADIVGAQANEVVLMNGLSANLHFFMVSFYQPTTQRHKIMIEGHTFPSDFVAVTSQISFHGYDPNTSLISVYPRDGEHILRTEDILSQIEENGDQVALIMFEGVDFSTGQYYDLEAITAAGHRKGCKVGFDLAHAVGNVEMKLHDWNVDFACWCCYKYLNGGPGATGGAFIHEKHAGDSSLKKFKGWWGVEFKKRFVMDNEDLPSLPEAKSYAVSNPPVMSTLPVMASLEIFNSVGMKKLTTKQKLLTGLLETLLYHHFDSSMFEILTPSDMNARGCQLSVLFSRNLDKVFKQLQSRGVICDMRRSKILRMAPCPLYNSFSDVFRFIALLKEALK